MPSVHTFTIFADYFQFIIQDEASDDDFAAIWTPDALAAGTAFGKMAICPGTLRNVEVPIEKQSSTLNRRSVSTMWTTP